MIKRIVILVLCSLLFSSVCGFSAAGVTFYSPDTNHLWNRLYATLFVRLANDGEVYDDLLDPPFWTRTRYLLQGESHERALALLKEFSKEKALRDEMPALKRALMQRDLIAVFFWLTGLRVGERKDLSASETKLGLALAEAIRFIALSESVIRDLRDNYSAAVESKSAPTEFNETKPTQAFLPADLLDERGPWIAVGEKGDRLAATVHFQVFRGRSAFEVRFVSADCASRTADVRREIPPEEPRRAFVTPQIAPFVLRLFFGCQEVGIARYFCALSQ